MKTAPPRENEGEITSLSAILDPSIVKDAYERKTAPPYAAEENAELSMTLLDSMHAVIFTLEYESANSAPPAA